MAAAYQTGTASSPSNLLTTLITWLNAQGWTTDSSATDGSGRRAHLHKSGLYLNFRSAMDEKIFPRVSGFRDHGQGYGLGFYLGDGYSGAQPWHNQSGRPKLVTPNDPDAFGVGMQLPAGAIAAYHFFDNGSDHVTIVVEKSPGLFVHLGWGPSLVKTGYSTDFPYCFGSSPDYDTTYQGASTQPGHSVTADCPLAHTNQVVGQNWVRCCGLVKVDATTYSLRWISNCFGAQAQEDTFFIGATGRELRSSLNQTNASGTGNDGEFPNYRYLKDRAFQSAYTGALLLPLHQFVLNASGRWSPIGYPPSVFYSPAVGHGFAQGQIYAVGGLNYMVFPNFAVRKAA